MTKYVAVIKTPGTSPESPEPPPAFDTANEAWEYLAQARRDHEDVTGDSGNAFDDESPYSEVVDDLDSKVVGSFGPNLFGWDGTGSVNGFTPGYDGDDRDLGITYEVQEADQ